MSVQSQRVSITGGRGRMASLLAGHLRAEGVDVRLLSREGDADFAPITTLFEPASQPDADVLLHLAWSTLPASSETDPGREEREDLPLLARLLERLAEQPAERRTHFVFFSSGGAVYGNAPGRPSREDDVCAPIGRYGQAKLAAERMILAHMQSAGLSAAILRISNPYGYPVPASRRQGLIPHALRCAHEGQVLSIWGDGSARKDFLHYTDFLRGLDAVLRHRLTGIYNLSSGQSHRVDETLALVEAATGRRLARQTLPPPLWDVHDSRIDNAKLRAATGWEPVVDFAEGIRHAAADFSST